MLTGLADAAAAVGLDRRTLLERATRFVHATTQSTNAVLARTGAKTAVLTTRGFGDTLMIMRSTGRVAGLSVLERHHYRKTDKPKPLANERDIFEIKPLGAHARERMGYNTQKPVELLERFIAASTDPGDVVFDPFCGCATTIEAARKLGRRWIGIDIAIHAIKRVASVRLRDRLALKEGGRLRNRRRASGYRRCARSMDPRQIPFPKVGRRASGRLRNHQANCGRRD